VKKEISWQLAGKKESWQWAVGSWRWGFSWLIILMK